MRNGESDQMIGEFRKLPLMEGAIFIKQYINIYTSLFFIWDHKTVAMGDERERRC